MKLPLEQRLVIEALSNKHTKIDGTFRKRNRTLIESYLQGFPVNVIDIIEYTAKIYPTIAREVIINCGFEDPVFSSIKIELARKILQKANPNMMIKRQ